MHDTRSLFQQVEFRLLEFDDEESQSNRLIINYLAESAPDIYESIRRGLSTKLPTLNAIVEGLLAALSREAEDKLAAIELVHMTVNTSTLHGFNHEVPEACRARVLEALLSASLDGNPQIRVAAVEALGAIMSEENQVRIANELCLPEKRLSDPDEDVALASLRLLGKVDSDIAAVAVPALGLALMHASPKVQVAAARQLGSMDKDAIPAISGLLRVARESLAVQGHIAMGCGTSYEAAITHALERGATDALFLTDGEDTVSSCIQKAVARAGLRLRAVLFGSCESHPWWWAVHRWNEPSVRNRKT